MDSDRFLDSLSKTIMDPDPIAAPPTAPIVAAGLIGGYSVARLTGNRPLGGLVLGAAGLYAGNIWRARRGPVTAAALTAAYIAAFGLSHPLAKAVGAWPSVLAVTGATSAAAWRLNDSVPAAE